MNAKGYAHKYGDHVDTDVIIPARYLNTQSHAELATHCMEDIDKDFIGRVQPGDIMVAGANFGCGSSREHAPIALAASGISCVIAASFARIFYRKYPKFVKRLEGRPDEYNKTVDDIANMEKEGTCFVIRPKRPLEIGRMSHDVKEVIRAYERGRSDAFDCLDEMKAWMKEEAR